MAATRTRTAAAASSLQTVAVWVLEDLLASRHRRLRIGDDLQALVQPVEADLDQLLAHIGVAPAWIADVNGIDQPDGARRLRARIERIDAVTVRYRRHADDWRPAPGTAQTRQVESTCQPDPARSVWPPSGAPVLVGFLLTLAEAALSRGVG